MCGIAGSINHPLDVQQLTRDLWHRGPDEQSDFNSGNLLFHHHRLAILDIACGQQPMHHGQYTIIFNGEIYNYRELKEKYKLNCQTNSDTESILHLFEQFGAGFLNEMDGMFAMAIYDRNKDTLFLARDRSGKKPLYYYHKDNSFVFASELNALRNQLHLEINDQHIQQFVRMGYFYKTFTPYKHVWELPAGSYAFVSLNKATIEIKKWWNIHDSYLQKKDDDQDRALETVNQILHTAVRNRVEASDLEVGSFLSGGIDSGIVTAIASNYNRQLKTFTISFEGEYDEAPLAQKVAERYGTQHHEINISFEHLKEDVENILANYGEPFFDSSAIPSYYVSREAKKYLTVILNGDGGDEIFGGYRRYVPFAKYDFFSPGMFVKAIAKMAHAAMPVPHDKKTKYNYAYRLADMARKDGLDTYLSATIDSFEGFTKYLVSDPAVFDPIREDFEIIRASSLSGLQKIMNLDFDNILAGDLLVKMDIATMAHSLEGRSPLLCKGLLEYVPGLSDKLKIRGSQTKFLLRKLAEKYLPKELINQPKRGFEIPLKKWIDGELNELIRSYILTPNAYCRNYVVPGFIEKIWDRKIRMSDEKRAKMIWTLFALEVWYKRCWLR